MKGADPVSPETDDGRLFSRATSWGHGRLYDWTIEGGGRGELTPSPAASKFGRKRRRPRRLSRRVQGSATNQRADRRRDVRDPGSATRSWSSYRVPARPGPAANRTASGGSR